MTCKMQKNRLNVHEHKPTPPETWTESLPYVLVNNT